MTETEFDQSLPCTIVSGGDCSVHLGSSQDAEDAAIEYGEQHGEFLQTRNQQHLETPPLIRVTVEVTDPRTGITDRSSFSGAVDFMSDSNGLVCLVVGVPSERYDDIIYGVLLYCGAAEDDQFKSVQAVVRYEHGDVDDAFVQAPQTFALLHRRCIRPLR